MKVLLINGSPHEQGCTYTALAEVASQLELEGIETEIFHLGTKPIHSCVACDYCLSGCGRCAFDDCVNEGIEKILAADGVVIGSPVHFAGASGTITCFLDRVFRAAKANFRGKLGAAVVSCRRGGATAAFEQLNKYFTISSMPLVTSQYWNMVHGSNPEQVRQDLEGMQIMRTLGRNMAWLLKCIEAGKQAGVALPETEKPIKTNFIR